MWNLFQNREVAMGRTRDTAEKAFQDALNSLPYCIFAPSCSPWVCGVVAKKKSCVKIASLLDSGNWTMFTSKVPNSLLLSIKASPARASKTIHQPESLFNFLGSAIPKGRGQNTTQPWTKNKHLGQALQRRHCIWQ